MSAEFVCSLLFISEQYERREFVHFYFINFFNIYIVYIVLFLAEQRKQYCLVMCLNNIVEQSTEN